MENRKYKVCRDNVYVGEVVKTSCVYRRGVDINLDLKPGELDISYFKKYRSMLFVLNEEGLASDLLYRSPYYPVLNITDDKVCMDFDNSIILVRNAYNLAELLECFGYEKELTYEDIIKIRKFFFSSKFIYANCQLFGYKEMELDDWIFYKNDIEITKPSEVKKCLAYIRWQRICGHRTFTSIGEGILPRNYFEILNNRRDSGLIEYFSHEYEKIDAFAPHKNEGKIKKLTR